MSFINIEIKARTSNTDAIRRFLLDNGAMFHGTDLQTDTYFNVQQGRLKLREGNIENNLIYYQRIDQHGPKQSDFQLTQVADAAGLKAMLSAAIGIKIVVQKKREIYFIENIKFHLDELEGLGQFVEIEASNKNYSLPVEKLHEQCNYYLQAFRIEEKDLLQHSYSDMLMGVE
ncbi:MAG: class IV adenylate cyclase [Chitinophagaceae bacterium]